MMVRVALVIPLAALIVACGGNRAPAARFVKPVTPVSPSSAIATTGGASTQGRQDVLVTMQDACDPDSFNTALQDPNTYREVVEHTGNLKFECCIHPWMRLEVSSR
jgi:hypothetical protein